MRLAAYALRSIREPYTSVQYDQIICMVLRSGSFESGVRRSEMKKYAYDAGEMILAPRHVEHWFRTDDLHLLVVGISDAALTAACDGGKADLRYGPKLVDARVGELITAVNAERIAGFPNGPLFLDSAEKELAGALVDRQAVRRHSASTYRGGLTPARVRRVVDLVHAKIEEEVTLNELAKSVGLSTAHFSQTFLKSTGKSPHQFVLHHRIERAKQMLRRPTCESWMSPWPAASKRSSTLRECSGNCAEPAQRNIGKNFCARSDLALTEDAT